MRSSTKMILVVLFAGLTPLGRSAYGQCELGRFHGITGGWGGYSVGVDGEWLAFGVPYYDTLGLQDRGFVRVYRKNDNGTPNDATDDQWQFFTNLYAADPEQYAQFGRSISVSGNFIAVGTPYKDNRGTNANSGEVDVFRFDGSSWVHDNTVWPAFDADHTAGDDYGWSVALSKGPHEQVPFLVVGAPGHDSVASNAGAVYVYRRQLNPITLQFYWAQETKLTPVGIAASDQLGISVAAVHGTGERIAAGAPYDDDGANSSGSVWVFSPGRTGGWSGQKLISPSPQASAQFGRSVAIAHSATLLANVLVVGEPYYDRIGIPSSHPDTGRAHIFQSSGGSWVMQRRFAGFPDGTKMGWSVATSGDAIVVGATDDYGALPPQPAGLLLRQGSSWADNPVIYDLIGDDTVMGDRFGEAVAVDDETAVVGALRASQLSTDAGAAYAFGVGPDTDNDTYADICDNCPYDFNDDQADADIDTVGDVCDVCSGFDDLADADGDDTPDGCDNCPTLSNSGQEDGDADGFGDVCDNCSFAANGPDSSTCIAGLVTTCSTHEECDTSAGAMDGFCSAPYGVCIAGLVTTCTTDADCDDVGGDGTCVGAQSLTDPLAGDGDGDGTGDLCDNCPNDSNANQADYNGNGLGDVCDPAFSIGDELLPPDDPAYADAVPAAYAIAQVTPPIGVFYYDKVFCASGTPSSCSLWEGRWFVNEPGVIEVQWKDINGANVGDPVTYVATDSVATPPVGASYDIAGVQYFRNWANVGNGAPVTIDTSFDLTIRYNSTFQINNPPTEPSDVEVLANIVTVHGTEPGKVIFQYTDGPGGRLMGFEVADIHDFTRQDLFVDVGRKLEIPSGADCKASFIQNVSQNGFAAAWQRSEATLDIWPIRPEPTVSNFVVAWYRSSPFAPNCWHQAIRGYVADWPDDPQEHIVVEDATPDTPVVTLPVGEEDVYCAAQIMFPSQFSPPFASLIGNQYNASAAGYAVLRLDVKSGLPGATCGANRVDVKFEVIRSYDHETAYDAMQGIGVFEGDYPVPIGSQLTHPEHDTNTPGYPFGYLYAGQPFAPDIYADTGQIFPVNSFDVHGPLEVWWFEESSYAPDTYWPHRSARYQAQWPVSTTAGLQDRIIIASRSGAGDYPDGAEIYHQGEFGGDDTIPGWNPNDEHALLLPVAGSLRAFAVRDDNPWNVGSGHPYVLVKYPEKHCNPSLSTTLCNTEADCSAGQTCDPTGLWLMGVHEVVAEEGPFDFDYSEFPNQSDPSEMLPVVAGLPIDPLFPVNFASAACMNNDVPPQPLTQVVGDALWVDRSGGVWAVEQTDDVSGFPSIATIYISENWAPDDVDGLYGGCDPWRGFADGGDGSTPWPVIYRPSWPPAPPDCTYPTDPACARPLSPGALVDQSGQCGAIEVLHDSVGIRIIDPTYEVSVNNVTLPSEVDFAKLPPHLLGGEIGGGGEWPDRVRFANQVLYFRGIMSDRDKEYLYGLSQDGIYRANIDTLQSLSRQQLVLPLPDPAEKWVSVADRNVEEGWVTVAFQNDDECAPLPVSVEVWRVDCPPEKGQIRVIQPTCPFNEKLVLQHSVDGGGEPEYMVYQWQWSADYDPTAPELATWNDYNPPAGYGDGQGLREVVIEGASPFTLADSWWRVRYRGYLNCPCVGGDCNEQGDPWAAHLNDDNTVISEWTDPQLAEGWVKRVVRGINPFDQRVEDFHVNAASTYVDMISQAGMRFEQPVALNCTPENINGLGLIEIYETVLRRARQFSIDVGVSYDPATLAILLVSSKVSDLYMLLGNEAFADASDPTIGLFAGAGEPPPSYNPTAVFCFEDQLPTILDEELALLRGNDLIRPPDTDADGRLIATVYNRLPWNFTSGDGQVAYANNYQVTNVTEARELYRQGHGDAYGHYLTALKKFYTLLRHPVFDWIVSTESVLVGGQPVQVGFQYERDFAKAAAAKARTGAAIVSLTFRQMFDADPTKQDGYPDVNPQRAWGVSEWARRVGQGAYFDWVTANALLDDVDDDPTHANTIKKIDRTTVPELQEIAAAYLEIQSTLDKAVAGLNPLGLAANVVPFGLNPNEIEQGKTHFEQIFERAVGSLANAVTAFNYANDNTRRLRAQQDKVEDFNDLVEERELDFNSRLIEMFGKPYPEDIGLGKTYSQGYDGPDIFHYDYVQPSELIGVETSGSTTIFFQFTVREIDPVTGELTEAQRPVSFNVSTDGIGFVKPAGWSTRPELGEIQFARAEVLQALGRFRQALEAYSAHVDQIEFQADVLDSLYELNRNTLQVLNTDLMTQQSLLQEIVDARRAQSLWQIAANLNSAVAQAGAELLPKSVGLATDATSGARGAILGIASAITAELQGLAAEEGLEELRIQNKLQNAAAQQNILITGWQGDQRVAEQIAVLLQLVRALPAKELELLQLREAVNQAGGRYHSAIGRALRLLEARTAFRKRTADQISEYRYQDLAFRVFRNDALQKYRAQFDLAARYAYLAARANDYETNLLGSNQQSGREYLTAIVKERALGAFVDGSPLPGNGLAGRLAELWANWTAVKPQLGFNSPSEINRTFSLRWEKFRIPNSVSYDPDWRSVLSGYVVGDLNNLQEYRQYCQPLQPPVPNNPAVVIPISTTVQSTLNFFGWPSTGDATLPSDRFAIKLHSYGVRFSHYPGFPLNQQANVYLVPVGADIMRTPVCPDAPIREWHLLDQTLPVPFPIGTQDLETVGWMPTDALDGGSAAMVRRRLIPTVAACAFGDPTCTDISYKLTGRSLWNTRWLLIIPGSELLGADPQQGIEVFINGTSPSGGVRDIKFEFHSYGYSGCQSGGVAASEDGVADVEPADGSSTGD